MTCSKAPPQNRLLSVFAARATFYLQIEVKKEVDPRGLEPLTSAMRGRRDGLLEISGAYKTTANTRISALVLLPIFQESDSGCCTESYSFVKLLLWGCGQSKLRSVMALAPRMQYLRKSR